MAEESADNVADDGVLMPQSQEQGVAVADDGDDERAGGVEEVSKESAAGKVEVEMEMEQRRLPPVERPWAVVSAVLRCPAVLLLLSLIACITFSAMVIPFFDLSDPAGGLRIRDHVTANRADAWRDGLEEYVTQTQTPWLTRHF